MSEVLTAVGRQAWLQMGGDVADLRLVRAAHPPLSLPSRLDVAGLLGDCVSLATLALHVVQAARRQTATSPVRVDGGRVTTAARSERHFLLDGVAPVVWAPLSGFWEAADGWVRTHANYAHHAERLAALLGLDHEPSRERMAAAVARHPAQDLEDAAAAAGAVVGAVRTAHQWADHPHAAAVARLPLVSLRPLDDTAGPLPWRHLGPAPLAGVRVLDLTRVLAGPVATRNLALAGAEVLRIDSPHLPEIGWVHLDTGAGKRSATLDLRSAAGRRTFEDLLEGADIVVTGYRPGSLDRLGLSPEELATRRPGVIVGSVSAWGTEGPWAQRRGFDSIVQAVTGIAMIESTDGARPGALCAQALDHSAGHLLSAALCTALVARRQVGGSRSVHVSLVALARELVRTGDAPGRSPATTDAPEPTLQVSRSPAGLVTCAAPPLTFDGAPSTYPTPARPWGTDEPRWTSPRNGDTP